MRYGWLRKPKSGTHELKCSKCGKVYAEVTHRGGEKTLEDCEYCKGKGYECIECYLEECKKIIWLNR